MSRLLLTEPSPEPAFNRNAFTLIRLSIIKAAAEAATAPGDGITELDRAQMRAVAALASLIMHRVPGNWPEPEDATSLAADLRAVAQAIDPLIEAVGKYADSTIGLRSADLKLFERVAESAIEGEAEYVLAELAEAMASEGPEAE
jgi:hypothetical protein